MRKIMTISKSILKVSSHTKHLLYSVAIVTICTSALTSANAEPGITNNKIIIGGVMDLEGRSKALGQGMKTGILAAIKGETVKGKSFTYTTVNDSYNPDKTSKATTDLVNKEIFLMIGNVGTPTAKVSLPILARNDVPAVGFFTGAGILRPGKGDIINYRASYVQETAFVINAALASGLKTNEICSYVQNDGYGMAGIKGIKRALEKKSGTEKITKLLTQIINVKGDNPHRNGIGPVGVYKRNTFSSRDGYLSLKNWEKQSNTKCRLIITVGSYTSVAGFIGYANMKKEKWIYSAVSFTGATNLQNTLATYDVFENIIVTQTVPSLKSKLPVVVEARKKLGNKLNYVTLEGYLVGKMMLAIMNNIPGDKITREEFVSAAKNTKYDVGGMTFDFTTDNQASNLVTPTFLENGSYKVAKKRDLRKLFE